MAIIISRGGVGATPVQQSGVPNEKYLEQYVADNPQSLPLQDIKDDLQLLMVARQFSTSSGPIDVLAVDSEGDVYIIETSYFATPTSDRSLRKFWTTVRLYGARIQMVQPSWLKWMTSWRGISPLALTLGRRRRSASKTQTFRRCETRFGKTSATGTFDLWC
jgi:hypothetical protein